MDMALTYAFRFNRPDDLMRLTIDVSDATGAAADRALQRPPRALDDAALLRLFFATPALPLRVIGGINWEALKLWRKGVGLRRRPPPPQDSVTIVRAAPDMSKA